MGAGDDLYRQLDVYRSTMTPASAALTDPADLFGPHGYLRGSMTLEALRQKVGSHDFFVILRRWAQQNEYGNVSRRESLPPNVCPDRTWTRSSGPGSENRYGQPSPKSDLSNQSPSCSITIWPAERRVRSARTASSRDAEASPQAGVITTRAATGGSRPRSRSELSTRRAT